MNVADVPASITPTQSDRPRRPPADVGHKPGWPSPRHIVAVRFHLGQWSIADRTKIEKARAEYEAGTHEMCQGRDRRPDGDWFVLFSIPRRKRCGARKFFQVEG